MWDRLRRLLNNNKSRNSRIVTVKENRWCNHCGKVISYGSECLSVNPKGQGRKWICRNCVELKWQIDTVRAEKESLAFGDEGGWLALNDFQNELEDRFYSRNL